MISIYFHCHFVVQLMNMNVHVVVLERETAMEVAVFIRHFVMGTVMVIVVERLMYKDVSINYMIVSAMLGVTLVVKVVVVVQWIRLSYGAGIKHFVKHVKNYINNAMVLQTTSWNVMRGTCILQPHVIDWLIQ